MMVTVDAAETTTSLVGLPAQRKVGNGKISVVDCHFFHNLPAGKAAGPIFHCTLFEHTLPK